MAIKKVVSGVPEPTNIVPVTELDQSTKLYGIQHGKNPAKRYKLHQSTVDGGFDACGFLNSTGHLNEAEGFDSLEDVLAYCNEKGHTMYQFDNVSDMAHWLTN